MTDGPVATNVRSLGQVTWRFAPPDFVEIHMDAALLDEMPRNTIGNPYFKMGFKGLEAVVEHLRVKKTEHEVDAA